MTYVKFPVGLVALLACFTMFMPNLAMADGDKKHEHGAVVMEGNPLSTMMMYRAKSKIGKYIPENLGFINQDGTRIELQSLTDKPLLVSFIYAQCPHICPTITAHLAKAVAAGEKLYGKDSFRTVTISFDAENDTPQIMKEYGEQFTEDFSSWCFGVAEKETVEALTKAFGFMFIKSDNLPFNHTNMVSIVHRGGMVVQQVFGTDFPEDEFVRVLKILLDDIKAKDIQQN